MRADYDIPCHFFPARASPRLPSPRSVPFVFRIWYWTERCCGSSSGSMHVLDLVWMTLLASYVFKSRSRNFLSPSSDLLSLLYDTMKCSDLVMESSGTARRSVWKKKFFFPNFEGSCTLVCVVLPLCKLLAWTSGLCLDHWTTPCLFRLYLALVGSSLTGLPFIYDVC